MMQRDVGLMLQFHLLTGLLTDFRLSMLCVLCRIINVIAGSAGGCKRWESNRVQTCWLGFYVARPASGYIHLQKKLLPWHMGINGMLSILKSGEWPYMMGEYQSLISSSQSFQTENGH